MGAVSILAIAILVLSVVLGVRAGQIQLEFQRRQQVGIALQNAIDHRTAGNLQSALAEYQRVLLLDPGNAAAVEGIEHLFQLAASGAPLQNAPLVSASPLATPVAASTNVTRTDGVSTAVATAIVITPTVQPTTSTAQAVNPSLDAIFEASQKAFRAGRWQETVNGLQRMQQQNLLYRRQEVEQFLFDAYVNLALEKDNDENLEGALALYDMALSLRPDAAEVTAERNLVDAYLEALTYYGADWQRAVELLTRLYAKEPGYRDVEERLKEAIIAYGESLTAQSDWCAAVEQFDSATALTSAPELLSKRAAARTLCENGGTPIAATPQAITNTQTLQLADAATRASAATPEPDDAPIGPPTVRAPSGGPTVGSILYAGRDLVDGRMRIFAQPASGGAGVVVLEDGSQPALRGDGQRLVYRNLRADMAGLSAIDPDTGLQFRVTDYAEDVLPRWNPQGSRIVFASNREGDRRWRIYVAWAEERGEVTTLFFGESPAWHPSGDLIAHRGCDAAGNSCGLWLMDSSGGNRAPLTSVVADNRPAWSPDGRSVVFMSDGRDGNFELYRVEAASGQVTRLTDSPAIDALPTVSPDGQWVAFVSNRDGAWKIWAVPLDGGAARVLAPIKGDFGDWTGQDLQWVR
jgi:TolB protein